MDNPATVQVSPLLRAIVGYAMSRFQGATSCCSKVVQMADKHNDFDSMSAKRHACACLSRQERKL